MSDCILVLFVLEFWTFLDELQHNASANWNIVELVIAYPCYLFLHCEYLLMTSNTILYNTGIFIL